MPFGVFILHNGSWSLLAEYGNKASADQEVAYIVKMLGLTAKVFKRVAEAA